MTHQAPKLFCRDAKWPKLPLIQGIRGVNDRGRHGSPGRARKSLTHPEPLNITQLHFRIGVEIPSAHELVTEFSCCAREILFYPSAESTNLFGQCQSVRGFLKSGSQQNKRMNPAAIQLIQPRDADVMRKPDGGLDLKRQPESLEIVNSVQRAAPRS